MDGDCVAAPGPISDCDRATVAAATVVHAAADGAASSSSERQQRCQRRNRTRYHCWRGGARVQTAKNHAERQATSMGREARPKLQMRRGAGAGRGTGDGEADGRVGGS